MISCARRYSKPGVDKRADMWYNNTIICRRGDTMFRKTTLIVTMLVAAAQIHPETACLKLLRTDKQNRRQNAVGIFVGSPSPRLHGLNLFACYIYEKESARLARFNIQTLSSN